MQKVINERDKYPFVIPHPSPDCSGNPARAGAAAMRNCNVKREIAPKENFYPKLLLQTSHL